MGYIVQDKKWIPSQFSKIEYSGIFQNIKLYTLKKYRFMKAFMEMSSISTLHFEIRISFLKTGLRFRFFYRNNYF